MCRPLCSFDSNYAVKKLNIWLCLFKSFDTVFDMPWKNRLPYNLYYVGGDVKHAKSSLSSGPCQANGELIRIWNAISVPVYEVPLKMIVDVVNILHILQKLLLVILVLPWPSIIFSLYSLSAVLTFCVVFCLYHLCRSLFIGCAFIKFVIFYIRIHTCIDQVRSFIRSW